MYIPTWTPEEESSYFKYYQAYRAAIDNNDISSDLGILNDQHTAALYFKCMLVFQKSLSNTSNVPIVTLHKSLYLMRNLAKNDAEAQLALIAYFSTNNDTFQQALTALLTLDPKKFTSTNLASRTLAFAVLNNYANLNESNKIALAQTLDKLIQKNPHIGSLILQAATTSPENIERKAVKIELLKYSDEKPQDADGHYSLALAYMLNIKISADTAGDTVKHAQLALHGNHHDAHYILYRAFKTGIGIAQSEEKADEHLDHLYEKNPNAGNRAIYTKAIKQKLQDTHALSLKQALFLANSAEEKQKRDALAPLTALTNRDENETTIAAHLQLAILAKNGIYTSETDESLPTQSTIVRKHYTIVMNNESASHANRLQAAEALDAYFPGETHTATLKKILPFMVLASHVNTSITSCESGPLQLIKTVQSGKQYELSPEAKAYINTLDATKNLEKFSSTHGLIALLGLDGKPDTLKAVELFKKGYPEDQYYLYLIYSGQIGSGYKISFSRAQETLDGMMKTFLSVPEKTKIIKAQLTKIYFNAIQTLLTLREDLQLTFPEAKALLLESKASNVQKIGFTQLHNLTMGAKEMGSTEGSDCNEGVEQKSLDSNSKKEALFLLARTARRHPEISTELCATDSIETEWVEEYYNTLIQDINIPADDRLTAANELDDYRGNNISDPHSATAALKLQYEAENAREKTRAAQEAKARKIETIDANLTTMKIMALQPTKSKEDLKTTTEIRNKLLIANVKTEKARCILALTDREQYERNRQYPDAALTELAHQSLWAAYVYVLRKKDNSIWSYGELYAMFKLLNNVEALQDQSIITAQDIIDLHGSLHHSIKKVIRTKHGGFNNKEFTKIATEMAKSTEIKEGEPTASYTSTDLQTEGEGQTPSAPLAGLVQHSYLENLTPAAEVITPAHITEKKDKTQLADLAQHPYLAYSIPAAKAITPLNNAERKKQPQQAASAIHLNTPTTIASNSHELEPGASNSDSASNTSLPKTAPTSAQSTPPLGIVSQNRYSLMTNTSSPAQKTKRVAPAQSRETAHATPRSNRSRVVTLA